MILLDTFPCLVEDEDVDTVISGGGGQAAGTGRGVTPRGVEERVLGSTLIYDKLLLQQRAASQQLIGVAERQTHLLLWDLGQVFI